MTLIQLSDDKRQALIKWMRRARGREVERARMVLRNARGYSAPQMAEIFECTPAVGHRWIGRYEAEGPEGLRDRPRSERLRKLDEAAQNKVLQAVVKSPRDDGYLAAGWTLASLVLFNQLSLQKVVRRWTVRRTISFYTSLRPRSGREHKAQGERPRTLGTATRETPSPRRGRQRRRAIPGSVARSTGSSSGGGSSQGSLALTLGFMLTPAPPAPERMANLCRN